MYGPTGLAAGVLLVGLLGACGGGGTDDYCGDLESARETFESLGADSEPAQLATAINTLQEIGDEAPDEVADDWATIAGGLSELEQAVDDTGFAFDDLKSVDPSEVDPEAFQALNDATQRLQDPEFADATDAIQQHAESECGISLDQDAP